MPAVAALTRSAAENVHSDLLPFTEYVFLNTRAAPFDDVRVRRALDLAVDRQRAVARQRRGARRASLPESSHLGSSATPASAGLARTARQLVRESGTRARR